MTKVFKSRRMGAGVPGSRGAADTARTSSPRQRRRREGPAKSDALEQIKPRHLAIYIRTSTADQDGAAQLHALRRAAEARGWGNPAEFIDVGHSGAKASRPALDKLRRAARDGQIRQLLVFALDRLGRSLRDLLLLLDELTASGCVIVSLREAIDLSTPTGRLLVHLISALAEFEREIIRERVKAGLARVKATGKTRTGKAIGRPRRKIDLEAVARLRREGKTWRDVARAVKAPRRTVERVYRLAQNPA